MSEQPVVNGEVRQRIAIMERVLQDYIARQDKRDEENDREHALMFARLLRIDVAIAQLGTRVALAAGLAALLGTAVVQIVVKLLMP